MDVILNSTYWIIAGIFLILAEIILPGGIVAFLGVACLIVAASLWLGLVTTWMSTLVLFFISSLLLLLFIRSFFTRFIEGDSSVGNTDEKIDQFDSVVEVIETIGPDEQTGLVKYQGSIWKAIGDGSEILPGEAASIVTRENITLVVQKNASIKGSV